MFFQITVQKKRPQRFIALRVELGIAQHQAARGPRQREPKQKLLLGVLLRGRGQPEPGPFELSAGLIVQEGILGMVQRKLPL